MSDEGSRGEKRRVLIAGGGVAGLEAALGIDDLAAKGVEVEICDPRREFAFRPFALGEPYGTARSFRYDMRRLAARCGASYREAGIVAAEPERKLAITREGERLRYDQLVVACGARALWAVPGAITFWGAADEGQVGEAIAALRAGALRHLVFAMPGGLGWVLPLYELALLAVTELEKVGNEETRVSIVTPEHLPLETFGHRAGKQMSELLAERGVNVIAGTHPIRFEGARLRVASGEKLDADAVIALPRLEGRRIEGIPRDAAGFVAVDAHNRVPGLEGVFAIGDVTAFPVKQGGVATQQADAAAEAIAAESGAELEPRPFDAILRGVLWTGQGPRYLYGRQGGDRDEVSSLCEQPEGPLRGGRVTARYLTPLVDAIQAEAGTPAGAGERQEAARARAAR